MGKAMGALPALEVCSVDPPPTAPTQKKGQQRESDRRRPLSLREELKQLSRPVRSCKNKPLPLTGCHKDTKPRGERVLPPTSPSALASDFPAVRRCLPRPPPPPSFPGLISHLLGSPAQPRRFPLHTPAFTVSQPLPPRPSALGGRCKHPRQNQHPPGLKRRPSLARPGARDHFASHRSISGAQGIKSPATPPTPNTEASWGLGGKDVFIFLSP